MRLTKKMIINYLVDIKGNDEEMAKKIFSVYGTSCLSDFEKVHCLAFNR